MNLDVQSVASGLLHDTLEDSYLTKEELEQYFGKEVAGLVDGVTKISRIKMSGSEDTRAESLRKMILAMSKDIRVILIKLADRYHNMQTLKFLPPDKQVEIARETLDIYAPLAHRLGIEWLKGELEDLSFKYLKPAEYRLISENIARKKRERDAYIAEVKELLQNRLEQFSLKCEVSGRAKRLYSIYRKMMQESLNIDQIYDITAFRVLVGTVKECYEGAGLHTRPLQAHPRQVQGLYRPAQGEHVPVAPYRGNRTPRREDRDTDQDARDAQAGGGGDRGALEVQRGEGLRRERGQDVRLAAQDHRAA